MVHQAFACTARTGPGAVVEAPDRGFENSAAGQRTGPAH